MVVPYRHPALHLCLPLHLPALLCLQALCPARLPHHYPHMELEYIQILRKKKKNKRGKKKPQPKNYTVKRFYIELYQQFIVMLITAKTRNPEMCHPEIHLW